MDLCHCHISICHDWVISNYGSSASTGLSSSLILTGSYYQLLQAFLSSLIFKKSMSKYPLSNFVGSVVHAPSIPDVAMSLPALWKYYSSTKALFVNCCPFRFCLKIISITITMRFTDCMTSCSRATVSSSFIAILANVSLYVSCS